MLVPLSTFYTLSNQPLTSRQGTVCFLLCTLRVRSRPVRRHVTPQHPNEVSAARHTPINTTSPISFVFMQDIPLNFRDFSMKLFKFYQGFQQEFHQVYILGHSSEEFYLRITWVIGYGSFGNHFHCIINFSNTSSGRFLGNFRMEFPEF